MNRITTAITRRIAAAAIRHSWAVQNAAARHRARGERMEAWAHRLAEQWGCVDEALIAASREALGG